MLPMAGGVGSAQPGPRQRRVKPKKGLNPHQSFRVVVTKDGTFAPADAASRKLCKDRGMRVGRCYIVYAYEPRDERQWARAHQIGTFLVRNVEAFHGMSSHKALKKVQKDSGIACDTQVLDLGPLGKHEIRTPRTLAFGFMDNTEWTEIWRQMCEYIGRTYLGMIAADVVVDMEKIMLMEPAA